LVGLGLGDERDLTARGAAAVAACSGHVWLEAYTSLLASPGTCAGAGAGADAGAGAAASSRDPGGAAAARLGAALGCSVRVARREDVEGATASSPLLAPALAGESSVALLVVGDPLGATTHTDLLLRARRAGLRVEVVHNASIMNAAGAAGLQLYSYGATISLPFFKPGWQPDSWYERAAHNAAGGLHTLVLLDIRVREPDYEHLVATGARGRRARPSAAAARRRLQPRRRRRPAPRAQAARGTSRRAS